MWSKDGGGRNWVCNWSNCRGNREVALRHDLLASGNASAEYENKPGMGKELGLESKHAWRMGHVLK